MDFKQILILICFPIDVAVYSEAGPPTVLLINEKESKHTNM